LLGRESEQTFIIHNNFQLSSADSKPLPLSHPAIFPSRHATPELKGSSAPWPPSNKSPPTAATHRNPPAPVPPRAKPRPHSTPANTVSPVPLSLSFASETSRISTTFAKTPSLSTSPSTRRR